MGAEVVTSLFLDKKAFVRVDNFSLKLYFDLFDNQNADLKQTLRTLQLFNDILLDTTKYLCPKGYAPHFTLNGLKAGSLEAEVGGESKKGLSPMLAGILYVGFGALGSQVFSYYSQMAIKKVDEALRPQVVEYARHVWDEGVTYLKHYGKGDSLDLTAEEEECFRDAEIAQFLALSRDPAFKSKCARMWRSINKDKAVRAFGIGGVSSSKKPELIQRDKFIHSAEAYEAEEEPYLRTVSKREKWILIKPVLLTKTVLQWEFKNTEGEERKAIIADDDFWNALPNPNYPLAPGVLFEVDVNVEEESLNGVWKPIRRIITKVISVHSDIDRNDLIT